MRARIGAMMLVLIVSAGACGGDDEAAPPPEDASMSIWVGRSGLEELTRLGLDGRPRGTVDLCCEPRSIAVNDDTAWVTTDTEQVFRIDKATNRIAARIDVGGSAGALAVDDDTVWVSSDVSDLVRISADTNEVLGRTTIGSDDAPIVAIGIGDGSVWVLLDFALALVRVDPATGDVVDRLPLCAVGECRVGAAATTTGVADGTVWVVDSTASELLGIDSTSLDIRDRARLDPGTWYVAVGSEGVFVVDNTSGRLERVDPDDPSARNVADDTFDRPAALALGAGSVWLYDTGNGEIVRVDADSLDTIGRYPLERVRILAVG